MEADHPLGMIKICCHLRDGQRGGVGGKHAASETCFSRSAKTCFLIDISSKTASMTKSQSAKSTSSVVPEISARSRFASSGEIRPYRAACRSPLATCPNPLSTRS